MKTIFITIPLGIVARNILRTDVFRILKNQKDLRIVLILPPNVDQYLRQEIDGENIIIEEWRGRVRAGPFRHFILYPFMKNLVYTGTSRMFFRYGSKFNQPRDTPIRYFFSLIFFGPLSKITFLKRFCRWLDYKFFARYDRKYEYLFTKYQPSLIFVNNLLHNTIDQALVRIARRRGIPSIGMVKSWDNFDKWLITVLPDIFLVWNEKMRDDLIQLQDVSPSKIIITGVPQFDIYTRKEIFLSREEYCRQMDIDPSKKIIFFGSDWAIPYDDEFVEILHKFIVEGALKEKCVILVRPHFEEYLLKTGRFERFKNYPYIVLDQRDRTGHCFNGWDPSFEDMKRFTNSLYHCDIMITFASTLSLDAIFFDKPVINIAFDGFRKRPWKSSTLRSYKCTHYLPIVNSGAIRLVYSKEELLTAINQYLENPFLDSQVRKELRQKFCYKLDGKSGERIAKVILNILNYGINKRTS